MACSGAHSERIENESANFRHTDGYLDIFGILDQEREFLAHRHRLHDTPKPDPE